MLPTSENNDKVTYNFLETDPYDIAYELLLKDHYMITNIKPLQYLVRLWQKESDPIISSEVNPINNMIQSFNNVFNTHVY